MRFVRRGFDYSLTSAADDDDCVLICTREPIDGRVQDAKRSNQRNEAFIIFINVEVRARRLRIV